MIQKSVNMSVIKYETKYSSIIIIIKLFTDQYNWVTSIK